MTIIHSKAFQQKRASLAITYKTQAISSVLLQDT